MEGRLMALLMAVTVHRTNTDGRQVDGFVR